MIEHLTSEAFKKKIFDFESGQEWEYQGTLPAIVDFWAEWCPPCKMISPILEAISEETAGKMLVYKVNTDEQADIALAFGIQSIPSLLFIPLEGKPQMSVGALQKSTLMQAVKDVLKVE